MVSAAPKDPRIPGGGTLSKEVLSSEEVSSGVGREPVTMWRQAQISHVCNLDVHTPHSPRLALNRQMR